MAHLRDQGDAGRQQAQEELHPCGKHRIRQPHGPVTSRQGGGGDEVGIAWQAVQQAIACLATEHNWKVVDHVHTLEPYSQEPSRNV